MDFARRSAACILRDEEGRILLQHRDKNIKRFPNCWGFFGGGIEEGETPEEAIKREVKEELGIDLKNFKFFKKYELKREDNLYEEEFVFIASLTIPFEKLKKQQREGRGLGLFSSNEWKKIKIVEFERVIFEDLFVAKF